MARYNGGKLSEPQLWMLRTLRQLEVDFLIQKGGRFHLIETKLKETIDEKDAQQLIEAETVLGEGNILSQTLITPTEEIGSLKAGKIMIYPLSKLPNIFFE